VKEVQNDLPSFGIVREIFLDLLKCKSILNF
jgi:hypothetical protein